MNYEKIDDIKAAVYQMLPFGVSFDLIARDLVIGQTPALLLCVNGFISTDNQEKLLSSLQDIKADSLDGQELAAYLTTKIPFAGVELVSMSNPQHFCTTLLEGPALLCLEGVTSAIAIDVRSYISRSISCSGITKSTSQSFPSVRFSDLLVCAYFIRTENSAIRVFAVIPTAAIPTRKEKRRFTIPD